jgi:5-methylcytosine-specific restriction endonuclease McrA
VTTTTVAISSVTLLNASYEPLGKVSFKHAVRMLFREVATVEEGHLDRMIGPHPWPRVIRLVRYVAAKWMYRSAGYSRTGVLTRDRHRCAYCGGRATTIDHVLPASRGGPWSWLNTVAACESCNLRKADRNRRKPACGCLWSRTCRPARSWRLADGTMPNRPVLHARAGPAGKAPTSGPLAERLRQRFATPRIPVRVGEGPRLLSTVASRKCLRRPGV